MHAWFSLSSRWLWALILLMSMGACPPLVQAQQHVNRRSLKWQRKSLEAYKEGNFEQAERFAGKSIAAYSGNYVSLLVRGNARLEQAKYISAFEDYLRAEKVAPTEGQPFLGKAQCYMEFGDLDQALVNAEEGLKREPYLPFSYQTRGAILLRRGDLERAERDFAKSLQMGGANFFTYLNMAEISYRRSAYEQSIAYCDSALGIRPTSYAARSTKAWSHYLNGDLEAADKITSELILEGITPEIRRLRALIYRSKKEYGKALAELQALLQFSPDNVETLMSIASVQAEMGDYEEANKTLLAAEAKQPDNLFILNQMGFLAMEQSHYREAMDIFQTVVGRDSSMAFSWNNLGYCKLVLGDAAGAMEDIRTSISLDPSNSYAYFNKARVFLETNNIEGACDALNEAERLNFTNVYGREVQQLLDKYCRGK